MESSLTQPSRNQPLPTEVDRTHEPAAAAAGCCCSGRILQAAALLAVAAALLAVAARRVDGAPGEDELHHLVLRTLLVPPVRDLHKSTGQILVKQK